MTRKHFRELAEAIAEIKDDTERRELAHAIGNICQKSNSNFNWFTWELACGIK